MPSKARTAGIKLQGAKVVLHLPPSTKEERSQNYFEIKDCHSRAARYNG
jgi:hypothetical protein